MARPMPPPPMPRAKGLNPQVLEALIAKRGKRKKPVPMVGK